MPEHTELRAVSRKGDARADMLARVSVDERRLELATGTTMVFEGGCGPPVVLLDGGIGCGGAYWAPIIDRIAENHRVVVPDMPGLGESSPIPRLDRAALADWLAAVVRLTCEEKPLLVAHSLLGGAAARFAARHGDRLRRLVLYGTPAIGPYRLPLGLVWAAIRFDLRPTHRNLDRFKSWAFLDADRIRKRDPRWMDAFDRYNVERGRVPHVKRTMRRLIQSERRQIADSELRCIDVPTTLVWGRYDRMVSVRIAEEASERVGWPLQVIDDAGHVPHIEQPDAFFEVLARALVDARDRGARADAN